MKNTNKDNLQFRILYAIGIVLIVISHIPSEAGFSLFYELFPLYLFNIALFIFCSGYFYTEQNENKPLRYIWHKFKRLIVPLYLFNFLYGLVAQLLAVNDFGIITAFVNKMTKYGIVMDSQFNISDLFLMPITNGHQFVYNMATWFVVPLFLSQAFYVLFRRSSRWLIKREFIYLIICIMLGMVGAYLSGNQYQQSMLLLLRVLYFIPFFGAGFYYKKVLEKHDNLSNLKYFSIIIALQIALIYIMDGTFTYTVSWGKYSYMAFAGGNLAIAFWLRLSRILTPAIGDSKTIKKIADSTYSIMANHFMGFLFIKYLYECGQKYMGWFINFSPHSFRNDIWYYFYPNNIELSGLIYVFAGVAVGVWIQDIINWVKQKTNHLDKYLKVCAILTLVAVSCTIYIYCAPIVNEVIKQNAI